MSACTPAAWNACWSSGRSNDSQRTDDFVSGRITPTLPPAALAAVEAAPPAAALVAAGAALLELESLFDEPPHAATTAAIATMHPAATAVRCFTRPILSSLAEPGYGVSTLARQTNQVVHRCQDPTASGAGVPPGRGRPGTRPTVSATSQGRFSTARRWIAAAPRTGACTPSTEPRTSNCDH